MAEDDEPGGSSKPIRGCVVKGADDELWSVYDDDVEDQGPHYRMKSSGRQEYEKLQKVSKKKPAPDVFVNGVWNILFCDVVFVIQR